MQELRSVTLRIVSFRNIKVLKAIGARLVTIAFNSL